MWRQLPAGRPMPRQPLSNECFVKTIPQFYCWACCYRHGISLWTAGVSWSVLFVPTAHLYLTCWGAEWEVEKASMAHRHCLAINKTLMYYQCSLVTNVKCSKIWITIKKINPAHPDPVQLFPFKFGENRSSYTCYKLLCDISPWYFCGGLALAGDLMPTKAALLLPFLYGQGRGKI